MPIIPTTRIKNFGDEFKAFIVKGNAIDLAIAVVIGTAFNEVVNSLVKDIILGTITTIAKQPDFSTLAYGAIKWGSFLNSLINLLIVGLSVFMTIKILSKITRKEIVTKPEATEIETIS